MLAGLGLPARADEHLDKLTAGSETYSNVTVTSVSATDVFFTHSRGLANAKLKLLDPALQKHFGYDQKKAVAAEKVHAQASAEFHQQLVHPQPPAPAQPDARAAKPSARAAGDDYVAPALNAKSVRGQRAPNFVVENWVTDRPDARGKFMLIDFWATWCGPCRDSIPKLNEFSKHFKDRLVVIGVSDESVGDIRKLSSPHMDYAAASDTRARMSHELQITGIPHCILVDPQGVVRYEGMPGYLDDDKLQHFLDKYGR